MVPTMKYWKVFVVVSPPWFLYFLNDGILVVSRWSETPRKGDVYEEAVVLLRSSDALRFCTEATEARTAGVNCCLAAWRTRDRAGEAIIDMTGDVRRGVVDCRSARWSCRLVLGRLILNFFPRC